MILNSIADIYDVLDDRETLIMIDLDDTLICSNDSIGSDTWYRYILEHGKCSKRKILRLLKIAYFINSYEMVESITEVVLREIVRKHDTIIITSRSDDINDLTLKHINDAFDEMDIKIKYCNGCSKAKIIEDHINSLCQQSIHYERYIFIDDLSKNIKDVSNNVTKYNVECFQYTYLDNHKNSYGINDFKLDTLRVKLIDNVMLRVKNKEYILLLLIVIKFVCTYVRLRISSFVNKYLP